MQQTITFNCGSTQLKFCTDVPASGQVVGHSPSILWPKPQISIHSRLCTVFINNCCKGVVIMD